MLLQEIFDNRPADRKHKDAAIAALHRRLTSKGDKESIASAAYEVGRAFGIPARELARMYSQVHESGLQRHIGIKKYGKKGFEELQKTGRKKK